MQQYKLREISQKTLIYVNSRDIIITVIKDNHNITQKGGQSNEQEKEKRQRRPHHQVHNPRYRHRPAYHGNHQYDRSFNRISNRGGNSPVNRITFSSFIVNIETHERRIAMLGIIADLVIIATDLVLIAVVVRRWKK